MGLARKYQWVEALVFRVLLFCYAKFQGLGLRVSGSGVLGLGSGLMHYVAMRVVKATQCQGARVCSRQLTCPRLQSKRWRIISPAILSAMAGTWVMP